MNLNLLKNRNFLLYVLGQSISNLGSLMTSYALSLYVLQSTKSAALFAFILSVKYIPQIFIYPFSGVIVDKLSRKKLLIFFDSLRGIFLLFILLIIKASGSINLLMIYCIILISAVVEAFYNPATNAIIPLLFHEKDYTAANSFNSWLQNLSLLIGPILGTAIYSGFGIYFVLCCDAFSFFVVMLFTLFLKFDKEHVHPKKSTNIFTEFKLGLNLIIKNKDILFSVLGIGSSRFFINPFYTIGLPIIIIKLLNAPLYSVSLIQASITVGTIFSPVIVFILASCFNDSKSLLISRMGKVIPFTFLLFTGFNQFSHYIRLHNSILILYFSTICFFATLFNSSGFIFLNSYFQKRIPKDYLGRFASIRFMFYSIVESLGINFFGVMYGKFNLLFTLLLILTGAVVETILLSYVSVQKEIKKIS